MDEQKIKDILVRENYLSAEDVANAEAFAKTHHTSIFEYLLTQGLINNNLLGQAVAESYDVPYADLQSHKLPTAQVLKIPATTARQYRVVIFAEKKETIEVTTDSPTQPELLDAIKNLFPGKEVIIHYSLPEDIEAAFLYYRKTLETRFNEIIKIRKQVAPEIISEIFEDALAYRASDIHFEPQEKDILVRFRIDGVLHEAGHIPKEYYENVLNRMKVQANIRTDEHFSAQDGSIRYSRIGKPPVDFRVSIVPTIDGEKIVVRLLSEYVQNFTLADIGLNPAHETLINAASKKPFGMILVTGPTGAGKTTTLYALLKILNRPEINITTIEDPVEYKILGVNHIQVNNETNLTFAQGLRSIVRQDPDIILVGEIRDKETAEIGVNAALTGHLLLSTFHANDAATGIPRLLDMGVEPFLLASTLEVIISQRLARKICTECRTSRSVEIDQLNEILPNASQFFGEGSMTIYEGKGCQNCGKTGYKGRIGLFEFIQITPEMHELILKNPSAQQIWQLARKQGAISLFEDGIEKVKNGVTTLEEILRVATPPV